MRWYVVYPVPVRFVRFSCIRHPVGILYVSINVRSTSVVNGQRIGLDKPHTRTGNRVSWTSAACPFCDRSTNVLSVSYTVHIRFVRYTSVHSPPLRRLPSPDKHFLQIFCPFGVHYLYPFICDSTINFDSICIIQKSASLCS